LLVVGCSLVVDCWSLHIACCRWVVAGCRCADSVQRQWALELTSAAAAAHKKKHYSFAILTQFSR